MDYVECVTFSLQVGVFFLMQSFWNYLSNTVARKSFMGSFEFKFYIFWYTWTVIHVTVRHSNGIFIFKGLLVVWQCFLFFNGFIEMILIKERLFHNLLMALKVKENIYMLSCDKKSNCYFFILLVLITSTLGIRSHFRFRRIISLSQRNNGASNKSIVTRLGYFKDMNILISLVLFFYGSSFVILCADGLTEAKIINHNKFATDAIIANANICVVFLWLLLVYNLNFVFNYLFY